jgi:membrane protease YdiL (CAAX protease family)
MNIEAEPQQRKLWQKIFISPSEPRLRAGWRLGGQLFFMAILLVLTNILVAISINTLKIDMKGQDGMVISQLLSLVAMTGSIYLARTWLDKRSFSSLGLQVSPRALLDVLVGIALCFPMMGLIYWIELGLGWTHFDGMAWNSDPMSVVLGGLATNLFLFVLVGWNEELFSRGYQLQTMESGLNSIWAVLLSASVFGLLHLGNPGASWTSTLGILLAGVFLAIPYLLTRQLWISIGLHIGWNFFEGTVFGFPVSGLATFRLVRHTVSGPVLWTGGGFGPEAGLLVIPGLLLGTLLVYIYARSNLRKNIQ